MSQSDFSLDCYFQRIGYCGNKQVNFENLRTLHFAQLCSVPFENLDILLGRKLALDKAGLFQKIVVNHRGGYCFEVNGLLYHALKEMGFKVRRLLGRVHYSPEGTGRSHMVLLVETDNKQWIVDAGFGTDTPRMPLRLITDEIFSNEFQQLRFIESRQFGYMLQTLKQSEKSKTDATSDKGESWQNLYSFDLMHVTDEDIKVANYYTETHPESHFTKHREVCLASKSGKITLLDLTLTIRDGGEIKRIELANDTTYLDALRTYFSLELQAGWQDLKPIV